MVLAIGRESNAKAYVCSERAAGIEQLAALQNHIASLRKPARGEATVSHELGDCLIPSVGLDAAGLERERSRHRPRELSIPLAQD
jgi:hypothetical protein